jgi:hypothetical protein
MRRRAEETVREVLRERASRKGRRSESSKAGWGTRKTRAAREEYFNGASHAELLRHLKNNTPEWQAFQEVAKRSTKWDTQRIKDEFFSPKVRGKRK